jgi:hypothetical protein
MNTNGQKKLALPGSSYEVVAKILHAYALCGDTPANLDTVAGKAAMDKTLVSRNHGFLVSLDLLTDGKAKTLTPDGKKLAIAIGNNLDEDAAVEWRRIFMSAQAAKSLVDMLRVQKEIPASALPGKIAAALGHAGSSAITTGVNSLIEVLTKAGVICEQDGKYRLASAPGEFGSPEPEGAGGGLSAAAAEPGTTSSIDRGAGAAKIATIPIHVNIELHLPASSEQAVYDALFKSIRENLLA